MSYSDDSVSTDPKQTPNPRPDPTESAGQTGWLDALNSFLESAFLKADIVPSERKIRIIPPAIVG